MHSHNMVGSMRDPQQAALLSLIPGLGQIYNGQTRKGLLFIEVAAINLLLMGLMLFVQPVTHGVKSLSGLFGVSPNELLLRALDGLRFGTPLSLILIGLTISFVAFAVRDAYDSALVIKRRKLYPEFVVELPEATSGSYLFHLAMMISGVILAAFFLAPVKPPAQITEIEFLTVAPKVVPPVPTRVKADHNSHATGPQKPVHSESRPNSSSSAATSRPVAPAERQRNPQRVQQTSTAEPASPGRPAPPQPQPAQSRPAQPQPIQAQPAQPQPAQPQPIKPGPVMPPPMAAPNTMALPRPAQAANVPSRSQPLPVAPLPAAVSGPAPQLPAIAPRAPQSTALLAAPTAVRLSGSGSSLPSLPSLVGSSSGRQIAALPAPPTVLNINPGAGGSFVPQAKDLGSGHSATSGHGSSSGPAPTRVTGGHEGGSSPGAIAVAPTLGRSGSSPGNGINTPSGSNVNTGKAGPASPQAKADIDFGPYMADLQRRIKQHWFPPKDTTSKRVLAVFRIAPDGTLLDLRITQSSGLARADQAALNAVREASPLPSLPRGADEPVDIQFTFDYNVFGGSARYRQL